MELSPAQREAVEYLSGPQIILAGAGSGKTRVIVAKARFLIEEKGFDPESLRIITYSRKTQAELEDRMAVLGERIPEIRTFHALGMDLISEFGHFLGVSAEDKASEYKLYQYRKRAAVELPDSTLLDTNQLDKFYKDLESFISRAKDELLSPDEIIARAEKELAAIPGGNDDSIRLARDRWTKVLEAGKIYRSYERIKSEEGRASGNGGIDYGDMIVLAHTLLSKNEIAAATVRSRVRYILVDEFQDTNYAQVEILRLVTGKGCGVTVVGDDDQAIYRFRGASFASFKLFQKLFPGWIITRLEANYRSQAHIVKSAQGLIESDQAARLDPDKKMIPARPAEADVIIRKCPDDITEASSVIAEIKALLEIDEYIKPESIAILVRSRRHKDILAAMMEREGIEYHYDKKAFEFKSRSARALLALYEISIDPSRLDLLPTLIGHFILNLKPGQEREINYLLSRDTADSFTALEKVIVELGEERPYGLKELIDLLTSLRQLASEHLPLQFLERIIKTAGIFKSVVVEGKIIQGETAAEIAYILRSAESYQAENNNPTHAGFLDYFEWQANSGNEDDTGSEITSPVVIQTVHGSKGLEYDIVFMIGLSNVRFPPKKMYSLVEFPPELLKEELPPGDYRIQEERRLFYVGMTRARQRLYLYGVEKKGTKISRFVSELERSGSFEGKVEKIPRDQLITLPGFGPQDVSFDATAAVIVPASQPLENSFPDALFELWLKESAGASNADEYEKLKVSFAEKVDEAVNLFKSRISKTPFVPSLPPQRYHVESVSYTDLKSFRDCPLMFYFRKILRLPTPSGDQQTLGTVIHGILEEVGRGLIKREPLSLDTLTALFDAHWQKSFSGEPDRKERLQTRGHEILKRFLQLQSERADAWPVEVERRFEISILPELGSKSPKLNGRIDRIDSTPGGFEVVDYKTGKSSTAEKKGDLQLPIYSFACREILGEYASKVTYMYLGDGVLDQNSYGPEDLTQAKEEIIEIISEINSSDFIATPGYICNNCNYSKICPASQAG